MSGYGTEKYYLETYTWKCRVPNSEELKAEIVDVVAHHANTCYILQKRGVSHAIIRFVLLTSCY